MKQSMKHPNLVVAFLSLLITVVPVAAQSNSASRPNPQDDKGFTSYAEFGGSSDSDGRVFELDSSIGYNFTKHFGMDMGMPIYFVQASSSTTGGGTSNNGLGDTHPELALELNNGSANFGPWLSRSGPPAGSQNGPRP